MNASELKAKSAKDLNEMLVNLRKEQFGLRMEQGTGTLNEPHKLRVVRRDIARIKTVLNQLQDDSA